MPAINLDKPLARPIDPMTLLRVAPAKADALTTFEDHFQRVSGNAAQSGPPVPVDVPPAPPKPPAHAPDRPAVDARSSDKELPQKSRCADEKPAESASDNDLNDTTVASTQSAPPPHDTAAKPKPDTTNAPQGDQDAARSKAQVVSKNARSVKAGKTAPTDPRVAHSTKAKSASQVATTDAAKQVEQAAKSEQAATLDAAEATDEANQSAIADATQQTAATPKSKVQVDAKAVDVKAKVEGQGDGKVVAPQQPNVDASANTEGTEQAAEESNVSVSTGKESKAATSSPNSKKNAPRDAASDVVATTAVNVQAVENGDAPATAGPEDVAPVDAKSSVHAQPRTATSGLTNNSTPNSALPPADATQPANQSAGDTSATRSVSKSSGAGGTADVDRVRFVQRVSRALQTAGDGNGTLRLRLSPPELGAVRIEVVVRDGTMSARLEAETPAAKAALLDSYADLQQRLAEHDIHLDRFEVELTERSGLGTAQDSAGGNPFADRQEGSPQSRAKGRSPNGTDAPAAKTATRIVAADQLNVVI